MSLDPMSIFEMARRQREMPSELGPDHHVSNPGFVLNEVNDPVGSHTGEVRAPSTGADIRDIPRSPSDPRYRQRIPPPACMRCGQDHLPSRTYDHPLFTGGEEPVYPQEAETASTLARPAPHPLTLPVTAGVDRRVAIYVGRGDSFVVKVEENPPEWDDRWTHRCSRNDAILVREVCRALGVRVKDNTGGELEDAQLGQDPLVATTAAGAGWQDGPSREDIERAWQASQSIPVTRGDAFAAAGGGGTDPDGPPDRAAGEADALKAG